MAKEKEEKLTPEAISNQIKAIEVEMVSKVIQI